MFKERPPEEEFPAYDPAIVLERRSELSEFEGLLEFSKTVGPNERIFSMTRFGADKLIRLAANKAGIQSDLAHFHCAKHARAMLSIKTAGIENVRVYLGHKSIARTGEYLKVTMPRQPRQWRLRQGKETM